MEIDKINKKVTITHGINSNDEKVFIEMSENLCYILGFNKDLDNFCKFDLTRYGLSQEFLDQKNLDLLKLRKRE